jgi:hypothetical protein
MVTIRKAAVLATVLLAACANLALGAVQSTLQDPKNEGLCIQRFEAIITTYYANDTECGDLITTAMNTTVPADCPGGIAVVGSAVHQCMNKNNTMPVRCGAGKGWRRDTVSLHAGGRTARASEPPGRRGIALHELQQHRMDCWPFVDG